MNADITSAILDRLMEARCSKHMRLLARYYRDLHDSRITELHLREPASGDPSSPPPTSRCLARTLLSASRLEVLSLRARGRDDTYEPTVELVKRVCRALSIVRSAPARPGEPTALATLRTLTLLNSASDVMFEVGGGRELAALSQLTELRLIRDQLWPPYTTRFSEFSWGNARISRGLCAALSSMSGLRRLEIQQQRSDMADAVVKLLARPDVLPQLEQLRLSFGCLDGTALEALAAAFSLPSRAASLRSLWLGRNLPQPRMLTAIGRLTGLTALHLVTKDSLYMDELAAGLSGAAALTELQLEADVDVSRDNGGATTLSAPLRQLNRLTKLRARVYVSSVVRGFIHPLLDEQIDEEDARLGLLLASAPHLRELELDGSSRRQAGAYRPRLSLACLGAPTLAGLQRLSINMGAKGANIDRRALLGMPCLKALQLCGVTLEGLAHRLSHLTYEEHLLGGQRDPPPPLTETELADEAVQLREGLVRLESLVLKGVDGVSVAQLAVALHGAQQMERLSIDSMTSDAVATSCLIRGLPRDSMRSLRLANCGVTPSCEALARNTLPRLSELHLQQ